jgi:hypothetical protein
VAGRCGGADLIWMWPGRTALFFACQSHILQTSSGIRVVAPTRPKVSRQSLPSGQTAKMATELTIQSEKAFQKQPHSKFLPPKVSIFLPLAAFRDAETDDGDPK